MNKNQHLIQQAAAAYAAALLLAVPAHAAGFTDSAAIVNKDAVSALVEQGVISGYPDGSFDPTGVTRRSEMAKMISLLLDPDAAAQAPACGLSDITGTWAEPYVNHCFSLGIVSGKSGGSFDPTAPVTGTEAAKMLLTASGFDPAAEGFTGSGWASRVNEKAASEGLYQDYAANPADPLTRDNAALLVSNALDGMTGGLRELDGLDALCAPGGIAAGEDGSLLVSDLYHKVVWQVRDGAATVLAGDSTVVGSYGEPIGGYNDAAAKDSYFKSPWALAPFRGGWAVSDRDNKALRLISDGTVQTINGSTRETLPKTSLGVAFNMPTGLAAGEDGCLYVSDTGAGAVRRISSEGVVTTVAKNLSGPMGLCWRNGVLYVAENGANRVLKIVKGTVSVLAGSGGDGYADGAAETAAFSLPQGVAVGQDGTVYVADTGNSAIRAVRNGQVSTEYIRDMTRTAPGMVSPSGLLAQGNRLYVCDSFARKVFILKLK